MAHFGVQKAKMVALAGVAAFAIGVIGCNSVFADDTNGSPSSYSHALDNLTPVDGSPFGASVKVGNEKSFNLGNPGTGSWDIYSIENDDYCSASITDNSITITGLKPTNGDTSNFCHITAISGSKKVEYKVSVSDLEEVNGSPFGGSVKVGEQIKQNLTDPGEGSWRILSIENDDRCTAEIDGNQIVITGVKPTSEGTSSFCRITAVSDTKKVRFSINVLENDSDDSDSSDGSNTETGETNPDTFDYSRSGLFAVAGATIGGLTAMFAVVRRFFGRK